MNVKSRAESLATFRYVSVSLMETLSAWVPSSPEMEVKVMFGRHLWRVAQIADSLGHRTSELRAPRHHSRAPTKAFEAALQELRKVTLTRDRIEAMYSHAIPAVADAFRAYLTTTDPLVDEPSVLICDAAIRTFEAMRADSHALIGDFPVLKDCAPEVASEIGALFAADLVCRDGDIDTVLAESSK